MGTPIAMTIGRPANARPRLQHQPVRPFLDRSGAVHRGIGRAPWRANSTSCRGKAMTWQHGTNGARRQCLNVARRCPCRLLRSHGTCGSRQTLRGGMNVPRQRSCQQPAGRAIGSLNVGSCDIFPVRAHVNLPRAPASASESRRGVKPRGRRASMEWRVLWEFRLYERRCADPNGCNACTSAHRTWPRA
jgi:hypothetical protein